MTFAISLFKAKESLLNIGIIIIVVYLRDVSIINLVKQFLYQNIEALFYESKLTRYWMGDHFNFLNIFKFSGEVSRSWRYCNARPTRDRAGASS